MASPTLIDLSNYDTLLTESKATRGTAPPGSSDGNVFFDITNGKIELITVQELPNVRLPTGYKTGLLTISVNKPGTAFIRSTGSFVSDGFTTGKNIRGYGFGSAGNNVNFGTIASVNIGTITLTTDPGLSTETGNGDERIIEFGTAETNPLTNQMGISIGAVYGFERQQRRVNEFLRQYDYYEKGVFKYAGAYELVNERLFSTIGSNTGDDRTKLRGSGWLERNIGGTVTATYFGVRSLGNIESASQPYYQLAEGGGGTPINFQKAGDIDEAIAGTGAMSYLSNKVRTYGQNYDEKTLVDSGISEMSGYSAGFALGEGPHLTTVPATYPLANVYGTAQIAPWTGMSLERYATGQVKSGFNEAAGTFSWILHNAGTGTLNQIVAYLDAVAQTDNDIDSGTVTVTRGKRIRTLYYYDAAGRHITRRGFSIADNLGLHIDDVPTADRQKIRFVDNGDMLKTYPFMVSLQITVGANAAADPNGWYHVWRTVGYGSGTAITVLNSAGSAMKGSTYGQNVVTQEYDWAGGQLGITIECEGDGVATQAKTVATITENAVVSVVCSPGLETNI